MRINYCYMYICVLKNKSLVPLFWCVCVCALILELAFYNMFKMLYKKWCKRGKDKGKSGEQTT